MKANLSQKYDRNDTLEIERCEWWEFAIAFILDAVFYIVLLYQLFKGHYSMAFLPLCCIVLMSIIIDNMRYKNTVFDFVMKYATPVDETEEEGGENGEK